MQIFNTQYIDITQLIIIIIGSVFAMLTCVFLVVGYGKHKELVEPLDDERFKVKQIYPAGILFLELIKYTYQNSIDRTLRKKVALVYGEKYKEYYLRILYARAIAIVMIAVPISIVLYILTSSAVMLMLLVAAIILPLYSIDNSLNLVIDDNKDALLKDFPDAVSKMAILINSGLVLREVWEKVAYSNEGLLYTEMQKAISDINNGMQEKQAYINFASRCGIKEIKKFATILVQNMEKGGTGLADILTEQSKEAWMEKKHIARRKGDAAASGLLIPILLMFVGILIMVVVPMFANLGI